MKKGVLIVLLISLLIMLPLVVAEIGDTCEDGEDDCDEGEICVDDECAEDPAITVGDEEDTRSQIDKAYDCLEEKIEDCDSISSEEKVFSLLATGKCNSEVKDDSKYMSDAKYTAQAILALDNYGSSTSDAEEWLLAQNSTPTNLDWYIQIESSSPTTCTVSYSGSTNNINIGADKKITSGAGNCLTLSEGAWWLKVSPSCYAKEFSISCNQAFLTTLLYKKQGSSTIYVSEKTTTAPAEGSTKEQINSLCFPKTNCNYEASLWAALALDKMGNDVSVFTPYLVTMAEENSRYLPETFLYSITSSPDFRNDLLQKQKGGFWDESGDKFYDTALALYPFYDEPTQKTAAKEWLLQTQDSDGCWQGNIRNTAFILHSLWAENTGGGGGGDTFDCEDSGNYCMSGIDCDGNILSEYDCSPLFKCCDTPKALGTCSEQLGKICAPAESCLGGLVVTASDTNTGEKCCAGGRCEEPSDFTCARNGGICRASGCNSDEDEDTLETCEDGDYCCFQASTPDDPGSKLWIWILLILIVLVVVGIVFKEKLRTFWFSLKSKLGRSKPGPKSPPRDFPSMPPVGMPTSTPRRILPSSGRAPSRRPASRPRGEIDDVLKKLKDMGK